MFRSTQFKLIVLFFLIGIIVITGLGLSYIQAIDNFEINLSQGELYNRAELADYINQMRNATITALTVAGIAFFIRRNFNCNNFI